MNRLEIIKEALALILIVDAADITEHSTPKSLGADSLDNVEILMTLEEELDIEFTTEESDLLMDAPVSEMLRLLDEWLGPEFPENGLLTLTDDQFIRRYEPEVTEQGDYFRQREWCVQEDVPDIKNAITNHRCWTMVDDDDGNPCIVWGNRVVNRIYNIITRRPIEDISWEVQVPFDGAEEDEEEVYE